jgi:hypothetical protein
VRIGDSSSENRMRVTVNISINRHDFRGPSVEQEFRERFPFGKYHAGFLAKLSPWDHRVQEIIEALEERGVVRKDVSRRARPWAEYNVELHRSYDSEDISVAEYLMLRREMLLTDEAGRDDQGRLIVSPSKFPAGLKLGCAYHYGTVVSEEVRTKMAAAGLIGPRFLEVSSPTHADDKPIGQFWELTSSVVLPPIPRERIIPQTDTPSSDFEHIAGFSDGDFFMEKELHYPERAIRSIEPFDYAVTRELFCRRGWQRDRNGERHAVVSQRFRQFCLEQQIPASWIPVRLDPEGGATPDPVLPPDIKVTWPLPALLPASPNSNAQSVPPPSPGNC